MYSYQNTQKEKKATTTCSIATCSAWEANKEDFALVISSGQHAVHLLPATTEPKTMTYMKAWAVFPVPTSSIVCHVEWCNAETLQNLSAYQLWWVWWRDRKRQTTDRERGRRRLRGPDYCISSTMQLVLEKISSEILILLEDDNSYKKKLVCVVVLLMQLPYTVKESHVHCLT